MNETGESFLNLHYRPLSVIHRSLHLGLLYGKKIKNKGGRAIEFFQSFAQLSPSLKLDMRVCVTFRTGYEWTDPDGGSR